MKTRDVRSLHTRRSFQRYCKEKLKSVLRRVSFSSMLNFCRFLNPDFLRIKLFGCSGGNALLVLTWAKKNEAFWNNSRSVYSWSFLICGQEPNNIITEKSDQYKWAKDGQSVLQPKKPCGIFCLKDSLPRRFYLYTVN